ncbi:aminoglycoside phosphotransferase family protein [uncultured Marinobacter sp.]|uniref:aminoglycoside phosphotransferase family protein n=1 Tax=uncultured Marinobacter sp. TaxID=187379 RepID=UPI00262A3450|nr:aminoglycoside phosphotransferase family protein [uncultured Marinobacter sp.]
MLFVNRFLSDARLHDIHLTDHSVACISTTRPIYLVFGDSSDYPIYVIRELNDEQDLYTHQVHNHLYQLVGNQVPKIVGIYEYEGGKYSVQRGVKGLPWFQIKSKFRTEEARIRLENRLWNSLNEFHNALATSTSFTSLSANETKKLQPHKELLHAYEEYKSVECSENDALDKLVKFAVKDLLEMPTCMGIPQHGDFCLNNLIIDTAHVTVIDFEDFAITTMPMYDHFTLALSLPSCPEDPSVAVNILNGSKIICGAKKIGIDSDCIRWHFLHHILLRLGPWSAGPKRAVHRAWLKNILGNFVDKQLPLTNHGNRC